MLGNNSREMIWNWMEEELGCENSQPVQTDYCLFSIFRLAVLMDAMSMVLR